MQNAPFTTNTEWSGALARIDASYNIHEDPVRQPMPLPDDEDFNTYQFGPPDPEVSTGKFKCSIKLKSHLNM